MRLLGARRRLMRRGAQAVAAQMPPEDDIQRLWREADDAAARFREAIAAAPQGADLKALPEYEVFRSASRAFREAAEDALWGRVRGGRG